LNTNEFENKWIEKIGEEILKSFPDDFIHNQNFESLNLPEKPLLMGAELFGIYEIIDTEGEALLNTDSGDKVKYILYANKNKPPIVKILSNEIELSKAVNNYERHLDDIIKLIRENFETEFPNSNKVSSTINKIFQILNLQRH